MIVLVCFYPVTMFLTVPMKGCIQITKPFIISNGILYLTDYISPIVPFDDNYIICICFPLHYVLIDKNIIGNFNMINHQIQFPQLRLTIIYKRLCCYDFMNSYSCSFDISVNWSRTFKPTY